METRDFGGSSQAPSLGSTARVEERFQQSVASLHQILNPDYDPTEDADPLRAAERTGPRVYTLKNHLNENVRFFVFGCQGDEHVGQAQVADYIRKIISEHPELKPDFIVLLGDNFYPSGVDSPRDPRFKKQCYEMYGIPCFVVPGNHDFGYTKKEKINYSSSTAAGKARGMHQVAHSYIVHEEDPTLPLSKAEFWRQSELDLALLPRWNMPGLFYSLIVGNLQLFFMDSNHFADDYLSMIESDAPLAPEKNQVVWLIREFQACKEAGRTAVIFQHHPLVDLSKRARYGDGDAHLYLDSNRWKRLAKQFGLGENDYQYDALLSKILLALDIKFAACFGAHVHGMYNVFREQTATSPRLCQFVIGSGGGELQDRKCFKDNETVGFFLKELGFMAFSCNKMRPENMNLTAFSVAGHELKLTNSRALPITLFKDQDRDDISELYQLVLGACRAHAKELASLLATADAANKPNIDWYPYTIAKVRNFTNEPTLHDVNGLHNIIAYFCQPELSTLNTVLYCLQQLMGELTQKTENSLFGKINKALKESPRFGKTIQELLDVNEEKAGIVIKV